MMKTITSFLAAAILCTTGLAYGQSEPGPNYKHLKPMEWIIGTWVLEIEADEDSPEDAPFSVKQGDAIRMVANCEWGLNKNVIKVLFTMTVNGKVVFAADGIEGWAVDKERIVGTGYNTLGGRTESVYTIVNDTAYRVADREVAANGEVTESVAIVELVDGDVLKFTKTDITVGGEEMPDDPPLEFKKKK